MFIDQAKIHVKAGDGGRGCKSFYRDKFSRVGVPNGGDGGSGGDVILKADRNLHTLMDFQYKRHFSASHGVHGSGKNKTGANAEALVVRVPIGTIVKDLGADCTLRDLKDAGDELLVVKGGAGGVGNRYHREATTGEPGEEKELQLDLKLIADVGVVGFPNAGKSTLICAVSNAHPKVAAYPFTTKSPALGVVSTKERVFVIADIPGLIEGSSAGRGLGDRFLRHVERTKILIHLIDMAAFEGRDPIEDYRAINAELNNYSKLLAKKHQIIAANKMDLEGAEENLKKFQKTIKKTIYPISALKKEGLEDLVEAISKKL